MPYTTEKLLKKTINKGKIKSVIHIGGHKAEEIDLYSKENLSKVIYIEPVKDFYNIIKEKIRARNLSNFEVYNFALGSENKSEKIHVADGSFSGNSSLLKPRPSKVTYSKKEVIEIKTYNSLKIENIELGVLDTEGYELEILKGMEARINEFNYLIVEFSMFEEYIGRPIFTDIDNYLDQNAFTRLKTMRRINYKKYNDVNYGDALYINNKLLPNWKAKVYKIRTKFVDTKIYFLFLIITDYSFHIKKLKQLIKKIISY